MNDNGALTPYATGPAATALVLLEADLLSALDALLATQPEPRLDCSQAIALGLRDWLTAQGLLPLAPEPEELH